MIRIFAGLIALAIVADFSYVTWKLADGATALVPAVIGAVVTALMCWRDAAASKRRRRLAWCVCFLAGCLIASLLLQIVLHGAFKQAMPQILLLGSLVLTAAKIARDALLTSRRRRERIGYNAYFPNDDEAFTPPRPVQQAQFRSKAPETIDDAFRTGEMHRPIR
jgi:hypothetical protein